jgi:hypothetical protein
MGEELDIQGGEQTTKALAAEDHMQEQSPLTSSPFPAEAFWLETFCSRPFSTIQVITELISTLLPGVEPQCGTCQPRGSFVAAATSSSRRLTAE